MLNILKELNNIKNQLINMGSLPAIEKDILLSQIRELYTMVLEAGTLKEELDESFELETAAENTSGGAREGSRQEKMPAAEGETGRNVSAKDQVPDPGAGADEPPPPGKTAPKQKEKKPSPEILAEKYQAGKSFINERLAQANGKKDLSSKLQSKPIEDIAGALGLNDKYKLIRDLFSGNPEIFEETVDRLNQASNFNEAFKYINANFDWEMEDESVQLLLDLVRRKFIVDKNG
jgi:hypothetical protein